MKAASLLNLILIAIVIVLAVLWYRDKSHMADLETAAVKWQKLDSLNNLFNARAKSWPAQADQGGTTIEVATAEKYINNYQSTAVVTASNTAGNSKSVWVDAASLSSMIERILEENGDGIRVYFSRYPDLKSFPDPKRTDGGALNNKNSIVIFTTQPGTGKLSTEHQDVLSGMAAPNASGTLKKVESATTSSSTSTSTTGYNYDGTCPPNSCVTGGTN